MPPRLLALLLACSLAGCSASAPAAGPSAPPQRWADTTETVAASDPDVLPEGIRRFARFDPDDPTLCAYLDRPRTDVGPEAERWLAERGIRDAGFPIRLYGENTPAWAAGADPLYVYCQQAEK